SCPYTGWPKWHLAWGTADRSGDDTGSTGVLAGPKRSSENFNSKNTRLRQEKKALDNMGAATSSVDNASNCWNHSITEEPLYKGLATFQAAYRPVHGYLCAALCVFGVVANLASIVVLTRRTMISSVNVILIAVAVADMFTMFFYFFHLLHFTVMSPAVGLHQPHTLSYPWILYSLFTISVVLVLHTIASWLTVTLAIFRYLYIALPTRGVTLASIKNAYISIAGITIVLTLSTAPNYLMNEAAYCISADHDNATVYFISTPASLPKALVMSNYWTIAIAYKILPCGLLSLMTVLLISQLSKAAKRRRMLLNKAQAGEASRREQRNDRREQRTTRMLLAIVIIFWVTELPQGVMSLMCFIMASFQKNVYEPLGDVLDLLSLVNNSCNFVLYTSMSKQFRDTFAQIFISPWWQRGGGQAQRTLELEEHIELNENNSNRVEEN
uniref:G_PROTEIN_RECEP_F1_2 domain-containing protein n=1 Tax=Macrostomum lignano TaxID=282301 RepID=A0A1I8H4J0_9PLAT